jgi:hypothetical protein
MVIFVYVFLYIYMYAYACVYMHAHTYVHHYTAVSYGRVSVAACFCKPKSLAKSGIREGKTWIRG